MKKIIIILSALTSFIAQAESNIAKYFNRLDTFSADFQQTVKQEGKVVQQSKGDVWLKKPLKFRWDYASPEKMELVSDGKQFYHYDVELAQATVRPVEEIASSALTTLLNDKGKIDSSFNIKSFGAAAVKKRFPSQAKQWLANADIFYLLTAKEKPKDDNQATTVIIGFSANQELRVFYAQDAFGENVFVFKNIRQNATIADKTFRFKPPKNVDILGQL